MQPPPPTRVTLDSSVRNTDINIVTHASHVDSDYNVFVDAQMHAINIGTTDPATIEEIELEEISLRDEFQIEEPPYESTPLSERLITRAKDLYSRYTVQLPTEQVLNVTTPRVTFEFENPAFEAEVTNVFQKEVQALATPRDLEDIVTLSDIRLSQLPERTIRVSRLGHRLGMTTRSGLQIGQQVHLYYDLSPLPTDNIELQTIAEFSNQSSIIDELTTSSFINIFEQPIGASEFSEDTLIDTLEESFTGHIIITTTDTAGESSDIPLLPPNFSVKVFIPDYGTDILVFHPVSNSSDLEIPTTPYTPLEPSYSINVDGSDYDLHPSFLPKKRKRKSF